MCIRGVGRQLILQHLEYVPASDSTCRFRIEHKCCRPKSLTCEHHRRKRALSDSIVDIQPTPMSVMCTHLEMNGLYIIFSVVRFNVYITRLNRIYTALPIQSQAFNSIPIRLHQLCAFVLYCSIFKEIYKINKNKKVGLSRIYRSCE